MPANTARFHCDHPGCTRSYKYNEHLLRHRRDHLNLRPYACSDCPAKFNRNDLLKRHQVISHGVEGTAQPSYKDNKAPHETSSSKTPATQQAPPLQGFVVPTVDSPLIARLEDLNLSSDLMIQLLEASDRAQLQEAYFENFHPHWPLLHKNTFLRSTQTPGLTFAVLVAGLWAFGTPQTRHRARFYHDALLRVLDGQLFKFIKDLEDPLKPQAEFLPQFQVFLIALILSTYRGGETYPSTIVVAKLAFELFSRVGVFEQEAIDTAKTTRIVRECYQRLALLYYKAYLHLNVLLTIHFPQFKPFKYLELSMLNVKLPSPNTVWERSEPPLAAKEDPPYVSDLLNVHEDAFALGNISHLIAWDFSLGMAAGCCLVETEHKGHLQLLQRQRPFLFLHIDKGTG